MTEQQRTTSNHDASMPPSGGWLERLSDAIDRSRFEPLANAIDRAILARAILARPFFALFGAPIVAAALLLLLRWVLR